LRNPGSFSYRGSAAAGGSAKLNLLYNAAGDRKSEAPTGAGVETGDSASECLVIVVFPDGIEVEVTYPPDAVMLDLLPLIATTHRIKLYRSEYVFVMSEADQERLMLQTPFVNLQTRVDDVGARTFQLQKKLYADSIKAESNKARQRKTTQSGRIGGIGFSGGIGGNSHRYFVLKLFFFTTL
jgi:hypothetical protein